MSLAQHPDQPPSPASASAAVLEFICLFTHDLRRKQKRWQDGRLKFHSFNKRVMVYDDRGNFVGDMHWRRDYDFNEGEEVELERGAVIVQVQDLVRRTDQDLSELIDKRAKEKEQRQLQVLARASGPTAVIPRSMPRPTPSDHFQLRHRPLLQVIGTPSGHHGKALVPKESPYEQRNQNAESPDDRAAKKRKYDEPPSGKVGYAQALFGQTLTLSATPVSSMPVRWRPIREPNSSLSSEVDTYIREQSNQVLRERPQIRQNEAESRLSNTAVPDGDLSVKSKQNNSLARNHHVERMEIPSNNETIEIMDPGPSTVDIFQPSRREKSIPKPAKMRKEIHERPVVDLPGNLSRNAERKNLFCDEEKHKSQSKKSGIRDQPKKTKPDIPNHASKQRISDHATLIGDREGQHALELARKPSGPRTELRIKSRKKRGLLMISEMGKQPIEPLSRDPITTLATTEETKKDNDDDYHHFGCLVSPKSKSIGMDKLPSETDTATRRRVVMELDEDNDPFQSSPPQPPENTGFVAIRSTEEKDRRAGDEEFMEQVRNDEGFLPVELHLGCEESIVHQADVTARAVAPSSPPQNRINNPYILSSSPPQEQPDSGRLETPSSPVKTSPNVNRRKELASKRVNGKMCPENDIMKPRTATRTRKTRRNVVLEDDDESEVPFVAIEEAVPSFDEAPDLDSEVEKTALRQQSKSEGTAKGRKRKLMAPEKQPDLDSEEEVQENKRRRSTRKTRSLIVNSEMTALFSDQDGSEEETYKRSVKNKAAKSLEDRPHLAKVKKSVKSRELIGFNLAALNVPLGPRGIGLPFKTFPSPFIESIQERISSHSSTEGSFDPTLADSDQQAQAEVPGSPVAVYEKVTAHDESPVPVSSPQVTDEVVDQVGAIQASPAVTESILQRGSVKPRQSTLTTRHINKITTDTARLKPLENQTIVEGSTSSVARISNPATRGRKAALKSHAAGQVPQRILPPTQPSAPIPISTADMELTPMKEPTKEPERPKKKMTFPGFQSARGEGPWSREAFDLLESGRPE